MTPDNYVYVYGFGIFFISQPQAIVYVYMYNIFIFLAARTPCHQVSLDPPHTSDTWDQNPNKPLAIGQRAVYI